MSSCLSPADDISTKATATFLESEEFSKNNFPFSQAVTYGDMIYVSGQIVNVGLEV